MLLSGKVLQSLANKATGKAAGLDGWRADHWILLPLGFFDALADLWNHVLVVGRLPTQWSLVRCALIPKEIGFRPISVAALAWRIGVGAIIQQLSEWIDQWAPAPLVGGLKGRSAATVHEELHKSLSESNLFGAKLDVAKCFDHVCYEQALLVWERLGAPRSVIGLFKNFYSTQTKTMEWAGFTAQRSIRCTRGLLQGCPASPALLAGLMSTWLHFVQKQVPAVRTSIFVDDRTLWTSSHLELQSALDASSQVDDALGLPLNTSKCELFYKASGAPLRAFKLWNATSGRNWLVTKHFKLLGVHYNLTKHHRTPLEQKVVSKVQARLRRLRTATRKHRNKRKLVKSLVLSLFAHTGPWTTIPKKYLSKWRYAIENTVLGHPVVGRSRFLMWTSFLGADLDPEFALDSKVVIHETWRLSREVAACDNMSQLETLHSSAPVELSKRAREVFDKWNWHRVSKSCFRTPIGVVDLLFDGELIIKSAMKAGWEHQLWISEPRAAAMQGHDVKPVTSAHKTWLKSGPFHDSLSFSVACGAGRDSRKLAKKFNLSEVTCRCGRDWPSACHLTWHCPSSSLEPVGHAFSPTNATEERLLVRSIGSPPSLPDRAENFWNPNPSLCDMLRRNSLREEGTCLVATDGSSQSLHGQRRAAWGAAIGDSVHAQRLAGCDQNIFTAESFAVFQVLHAAHVLGCCVKILCDSLAVVKKATRVRRAGATIPLWSSALWCAIKFLCPLGSINWVPAHGRHLEWIPPRGESGDVWRTLNDCVDKAVQKIVNRSLDELAEWKTGFENAVSWSSCAMRRYETSISGIATF